MTNAEEMVGKIVVARFANGSVRCVGRVSAGSNVPSVLIERNDGTGEWFRADMCEVLLEDQFICESLVPFTVNE